MPAPWDLYTKHAPPLIHNRHCGSKPGDASERTLGRTMTDAGGPVSRRKFLLAAAASGTIVTGSGRTLSEYADHHAFSGTVGTREIDLSVAWNGGALETDLGALSEVGDGDERRAVIALSDESNPAWVWFRTGCPTCQAVETHVGVTIDLDTGGGRQEVFSGTLREARETLGSGHRLGGVVEAGDQWDFWVSWEVIEPVDGETHLDFEFAFRAIQRRHLDEPATGRPDWACAPCDGTGSDSGDPSTEQPVIEWAAIGGDSAVDPEAVTIERSKDGTALEYDVTSVADGTVDAIALFAGGSLDRFSGVPKTGQVAVGDGDERVEAFEPSPGKPKKADPLPASCFTYRFAIEPDAPKSGVLSRCKQ